MEMLGSWSHVLGIWYSACCTVSARRLKSDNTEVRRRQSRPAGGRGDIDRIRIGRQVALRLCSSQCCSSY